MSKSQVNESGSKSVILEGQGVLKMEGGNAEMGENYAGLSAN